MFLVPFFFFLPILLYFSFSFTLLLFSSLLYSSLVYLISFFRFLLFFPLSISFPLFYFFLSSSPCFSFSFYSLFPRIFLLYLLIKKKNRNFACVRVWERMGVSVCVHACVCFCVTVWVCMLLSFLLPCKKYKLGDTYGNECVVHASKRRCYLINTFPESIETFFFSLLFLERENDF